MVFHVHMDQTNLRSNFGSNPNWIKPLGFLLQVYKTLSFPNVVIHRHMRHPLPKYLEATMETRKKVLAI